MSDPQRYDMVTNYRCGQSVDELEKVDDGEWVRWEDVQAEVERLRVRLDLPTTGEECCDYWQKKAEHAEAEVAQLRQRLQIIIDAWRKKTDGYSTWDDCADALEQELAISEAAAPLPVSAEETK